MAEKPEHRNSEYDTAGQDKTVKYGYRSVGDISLGKGVYDLVEKLQQGIPGHNQPRDPADNTFLELQQDTAVDKGSRNRSDYNRARKPSDHGYLELQ